ncbi:CPBP family intramembrane glutamic endopeptidase [Lutibacter sp. TH_r2]|uniref:CPBP family intramembrane glutamic endopeptidase n=1 Tax=Lutibacter sp. TH_r2 TaxID=3082083 RepID=UPI002955D9D0|nr:CPBP family intramembrane glutamic endopeptidase [Lutibacter sp. TH_r2]MDV7187884.1 CPBP family intramembrane glutamic endopeptidase [Lutibacter sp. TH_r2]
MKTTSIKIVIALALGILILMLSSVAQMVVLNTKSISHNFPYLEKIITHLVMLIFSILIILILNKGKLRAYGFNWSLNFPYIKIIFISLVFGFLSYLVGSLFVNSSLNMPTTAYSLFEEIIYVWILASISEEIFTRGLIQGYLSSLKHIGLQLFNIYLSLPVIIGAVFFGAMHLALLALGVPIVIVLNIVTFGILLGLIAGYHKEKTNSLIPAIIVHICFNIGANII